MRKGIIDRFEGEYAVIEFDGKTEDVLKSELPAEIKAGDTLIFEDGKVIIDVEAIASRKKEIDSLMDELFEE
jgi:ASC-1-like (ASCH) protein